MRLDVIWPPVRDPYNSYMRRFRYTHRIVR